jgi:SAM-dependent methyltransferase
VARPEWTVRLAFRNGEHNLLVAALVPAAGRGAPLSFDVHADDEMLLHYWNLHGGNRDKALVLYFDSGRRLWETQAAVLRWRFGAPGPGFQLLDFASGYGRVTRFALRDVPPERIWVADIYAEGVRFQEERFGVHGLVSHADPARFECDETFDAILVSSLFTHLPETTFRAWLARLFNLLRPGGVLIFSVHDEDLLPPDRALLPSGLLFDASSESGSLPTEQYGTTWVNEPFVRRTLGELAPEASIHRFPRGLNFFQDLYVVVPEPSCDFSGLKLPAIAEGFVEHSSLVSGTLRLSGWVVDRVLRAAPRELGVSIGGEVRLVVDRFEPRDEVSALFPYEEVVGYGWRAEVPVPPGDEEGLVAIEVVDAAGAVSTLYAEPIPAALLRSARLDLHATRTQLERREAELTEEQKRGEAQRQTIQNLESRIAVMELSRFWKLRNAWWGMKRRLRLG